MTRSRIENGCGAALSASAARTGLDASARASAARTGFMDGGLPCLIWGHGTGRLAQTQALAANGARAPSAKLSDRPVGATGEPEGNCLTGTAAPSTTRTRQFVLAAIILAAFAVRYFYVRIAVVDDPLRGDAWQYFCYAWNVLKHGTFSLARPMATSVLPDSFRDPGFPVFVAALMAIRGSGRELYDALLLSQCLLATATVGLYVSLAGRWMGFSAACSVGILLGLWPHLISFAGYVLSETLLGFLLALALWLLDTSLRREFLGAAVAAGLAFAAAALNNAVVLPMAPLLATIMVWRDTSRRLMWIVFLLACVVPPAIWLTRNAMLPA